MPFRWFCSARTNDFHAQHVGDVHILKGFFMSMNVDTKKQTSVISDKRPFANGSGNELTEQEQDFYQQKSNEFRAMFNKAKSDVENGKKKREVAMLESKYDLTPLVEALQGENPQEIANHLDEIDWEYSQYVLNDEMFAGGKTKGYANENYAAGQRYYLKLIRDALRKLTPNDN